MKNPILTTLPNAKIFFHDRTHAEKIQENARVIIPLWRNGLTRLSNMRAEKVDGAEEAYARDVALEACCGSEGSARGIAYE
jgi:hypothetical protein